MCHEGLCDMRVSIQLFLLRVKGCTLLHTQVSLAKARMPTKIAPPDTACLRMSHAVQYSMTHLNVAASALLHPAVTRHAVSSQPSSLPAQNGKRVTTCPISKAVSKTNSSSAGSEPSGMDQGQRAKWVSNASFATLTLIYTFTQILDLGTQMSTLAGVTMRIGGLLQVFDM